MNSTIETILSHRSVRKFTNQALTKEQIDTIVHSAQMAATSNYIQAYSIIGVNDRNKKSKLAQLSGNQAYVLESGHFFVFCADLHRHQLVAEMEESVITESIESSEKFIVAVVDTALAAQNATIAAESMGLGICYIGGIRNEIEGVSELLELPEYVIPLFGLTVGYPDEETSIKPRLPKEAVYHEDAYQSDLAMTEQLDQYDEVVSNYYYERTNGKRAERWTEQMSNMLSNPTRMNIKSFLEKKGFAKR
ncbi:oxygen-insensitive NADPH nitroreductase [Halalkalibacter alkaliphilus]|uniref:Oxygen-insensitive NADPH nitroreductase n=1 Tax=Halalkalibacter alkaliphilus TaxID=2917993 RepID=A0A9X2CWZ5_9BACI|nr:oxygen-insensitive NADPH nitroreductase [Halalkalibacter alkaliphilus]MCL7749615.1 oxygen-insensitive NADPH nitroreductase [Halalkalibacter alkaliphilus]